MEKFSVNDQNAFGFCLVNTFLHQTEKLFSWQAL